MPSISEFLDEPQTPSISEFLDEEPEVVATEGGNGLVAKINATLDRVREAQPDWLKYEPEWIKAPSEAARELITEQLPHDLPSYLKSIGGPVVQGYEQAKALAQGDVSGLPLVGRVPEIMAADETPAFSKERYKTALKTLMDVGALAGAVEGPRVPLRAEPLVPEPPPTQRMGPGTIGGDVSRALERRFTMQPEPPPDIAPVPPIEETVANVPNEAPLPFNPELGPQTIPEFQMPLRTETAMSPGAAKQLRKLKAHKAQVEAIGGKVDPDKVTAKIAEIEGVPPEAPVQAPGGVPVAGVIDRGLGEQFRDASGAIDSGQFSDAVAVQVGEALARGDSVTFVTDGGRRSVPITSVNRGMMTDAQGQRWGALSILTDAAERVEITPKAKPPPPGAGAPEPYTPEAAAVRAAGPQVPPVAEAEKAGTGEGGISIKNEYTEAKRQELGFPEAVQEASRDFGTVWGEAEATHRRDPGAGSRLVEDINKGKVKALDDHGDALLLREQIRAQGEHSDAVKAVNEAVTDADKTAAKARLQVARDDLQAVYDADKKAGRSTAQGLNARKMLAKEDYSLTQMEARKRAANNGERLSEGQLKEVEALHATIADLTARMDALDRQRFGFRDVGKEAVAARKSGKRLTDYTGEAAKKARERIQRQLHGLGAKPAPPTLLYDYAVVGADHLARGLTKFSDWSAQMLKEFGEKVKPHLQDLWKMARAVHDSTAKAFRTPEEARLERYKTGLAKQTVGVTAKIQRGDFTKQTRPKIVLDKAAYKMKGNLQRLKNEFERGVAKDAYRKMSKADKFWQHFVGVERAMKLSSPGVFEKLGIAAAVREVLAPIEAGGGYGAATFFPRLAKGTRYGADLKTVARAEIKAKVALFTEGMKDSWENIKGKETGLEAMSDKYGRQPDFWYNRIGKIHAAVKAPVKRAEFVRSLEHRMDAAVKAGEDINHPEVMDRLATESALDANRAIFQQNTVVSEFFSMADRLHPAAGRTGRFLFPVVKIPVNLFKEFVTYNVGAPVAAAKIGRAYWKGVETLPPLEREAIIRQLVKGSAGGAAILWGYYNSDKVHDFFASVPKSFEHTPIAMAIHEGSLIKRLEEQGTGTYYKPSEAQKEAAYAAKSSIPFMYTLTDAMDAITKPGGAKKWFYNMIHSTVVPQISSWTAKELDKPTPFSIFDKTTYRPPTNIVEAVTQGIPGLREDIPEYQPKMRGH